jgi:predicted Zn-ribbon and HTH transcriptional regulator
VRPPTPCRECGFVFDRGRGGARCCPRCAEELMAFLDAAAYERFTIRWLSRWMPPTDVTH